MIPTSQVRKAYKRLALQLHPDKSASMCRFTARFGRAGALVAAAEEVQCRLRERASWLFSCLGKATHWALLLIRRSHISLMLCILPPQAKPMTS